MLFLLCSYLHPGSWRPATLKSKTPPVGEVYLVVGREYHWEYNPFLIQSAVHTIFTPILSAYKGRENLLQQEKIKQLIAPTLYSRSRQPGLQSKIGIETKLQYFKTPGYYSTECWACPLWVKVREKTWAQKKENSNLWFGHFICPNQELFSLNQDWIIKKWGAQQHEKFWVSTVCYSILKQEYFVIKT